MFQWTDAKNLRIPVLAMLQAFADDSAAQTGDRRLFLAGYLHRPDAWVRFSEVWHAELCSWPEIEFFKASEAILRKR
jgi:hypothetical protein